MLSILSLPTYGIVETIRPRSERRAETALRRQLAAQQASMCLKESLEAHFNEQTLRTAHRRLQNRP
jgi:hypothetical protein